MQALREFCPSDAFLTSDILVPRAVPRPRSS